LVRSEHIAEELTQELFIRIWTVRENIDPERNFHAYIHSVAKNLAFKHLKERFHETYTDDPVSLSTDQVCMEEELLARETQLLIDMKVSQMPERRKAVFELSRIEGLSNDQIADKLKISKKTVENHMNTALKEIRQILNSITLLL
jgi:RNA polymerase sigma-70 factor (ECF subfamily)